MNGKTPSFQETFSRASDTPRNNSSTVTPQVMESEDNWTVETLFENMEFRKPV